MYRKTITFKKEYIKFIIVATLMACGSSHQISHVFAANPTDSHSVSTKNQDNSVSSSSSVMASDGATLDQSNQLNADLNHVRSSDDRQQVIASAVGIPTPINKNHPYNQYNYQASPPLINDMSQQQGSIDQQQNQDVTFSHTSKQQQIMYQKPITSISGTLVTSSDSLKPEPRNHYETSQYIGASQIPVSAPSQSPSLATGGSSNQQQQQQQQQSPQYNTWYSSPLSNYDQSAASGPTQATAPSPNIGYNQPQQPSSPSYAPSASTGQLIQWNQPQLQQPQSNNMIIEPQSQQSVVQITQTQPAGNVQQQQQSGQHQHLYQAAPGSVAASSNVNPQQIQPGVIAPNLSGRRSSLTGWLRGITGMLASIFNRRDHPNQLALQSLTNGQWVLPTSPNWLPSPTIQQQQQYQQQQRYQTPINNMQTAQQQQVGAVQSGQDFVASSTPNSYQVSSVQKPQQPLITGSNQRPSRPTATQNSPQSYQALVSQKSSSQSSPSYQNNQHWTGQQSLGSSISNSNSNYGSNVSPKTLDQSVSPYIMQQSASQQPVATYQSPSSSSSINNQVQSSNNWSSALSPSSSSSTSSWSSSAPTQQQQQQNNLGASIYPSTAYQRGSTGSSSLVDGSIDSINNKLNSLIQTTTASSSSPIGHYSRFGSSSLTVAQNAASSNQSTLDRVPLSINEHRGFSQPLITPSAAVASSTSQLSSSNANNGQVATSSVDRS